jgi:hypothetical protein
MYPDDFTRFFNHDNKSQDAEQSPLRALFPASVIELRASSVPAPVQFSQYLKRLETEPELQESFTLDLFRLLGDEKGFNWPLNDLGRCLALAVFRAHTKERLQSQAAKPETLADDPGSADWWKPAE